MADILTHPLMRGTTDRTIAADLRASLYASRIGLEAGRTWGSFKQAMEGLGITEDMPLASIEFGVSQYGNGRIVVDVNEDGLEVREAKR